MNKRQRKQRLTRYREEEAKAIRQLCKLLPFDARMCRMRLLLIPHPRRHWMSPAELREKQAALQAELAAEEAEYHEKLKTHDYTLAGWMPKREDVR
jgi:hypothetical protein